MSLWAPSLEQLPDTCQTAQEVAGILNVEACAGSDLTKKVLLESLSTCDMVILATLAGGGNRQNTEATKPGIQLKILFSRDVV